MNQILLLSRRNLDLGFSDDLIWLGLCSGGYGFGVHCLAWMGSSVIRLLSDLVNVFLLIFLTINLIYVFSICLSR